MNQDPSFAKRVCSLLAIFGLSIGALFFVTRTREKNFAALFSPQKAVTVVTVMYPSDAPSHPDSQITHTRQLPQEPEILAHSFLVQLMGDDTPLLQRRQNKQMRPASLTKILTSLIAREELDIDASVVFSEFAKAAGEKESSVPKGQAFLRDDAVRFALIESANDAAVALAEAIGRKRGAFSFQDASILFKIAANQKARQLGMANSQFENPTGLDHEDHYTTAQDMMRLVSYISEHHPELWEFSRAIDADITSLDNHTYHIKATNQLLSEFPGLIGGKTGLTDAAKGALILLYPARPDRTAVIIILGSDNRFQDGRQLIRWFEEAFKE
ncbi:MAG: hypothetical protein Q8R40_01675 [bacterium]|nr:hypothetical protein [bacterium]